VGFWRRAGASIIDSILMMVVAMPILVAIYGQAVFDTTHSVSLAGNLLSMIIPAIIVMAFWRVRRSTPGKIMLNAEIVDADTGAHPTQKQWILRYLGYFVSTIPMGLGFFWVAIDKRKQGWHDKIANTVVVRIQDPAS